MRGKTRKIFKKRPIATSCMFCEQDKEPSYKEYSELQRFVTDRAKIVGKVRSGLCSKHQRKFAVEVKRARHLGLLPFRIHV